MDLSRRASQVRFAAYVETLVEVSGHADRAAPVNEDCLGLLMPGERKSVEPAAAIVAPTRVSAKAPTASASGRQGVEQPLPNISLPDEETPKSNGEHVAPPPDPVGEVDLEKSWWFTWTSIANALWKAILSGEKADKTVEGWSKVKETIGPRVAEILDWLHHFRGS